MERFTLNLAGVAKLARANKANGPWLAKLDTLSNPANRVKTGTMKSWFKAHHGMKVDTIQSQRSGLFLPAGRTIDAERRAGSVELDGSARDYVGCTVLHADETTLLVSYDFDGDAWVMYSLSA